MSEEPRSQEETQKQAEAQRLLSAVEHLLDNDDKLIGLVEKMRDQVAPEANETKQDESYLRRVASLIVSDFSNRAMLAGGATALPAIVPGAGTLLAALGGTLADMTLTLKFEVEMSLCLTHLFGFDIKQQNERQIAFLLASVSTYDAKTGRNLLRDLLAAETTAIWNYTPRQVSKFLITILSKLILLSASKGFAKLLPVVGVLVGGSVNKVLTKKVGERCVEELASRWRIKKQESKEPVVDAVITDEPKEG
ncbi:MAG: EcsC family protein [Myxococcota bacterium]|jgi:uncharacterized protein (DUF697 family)|nr:EcsC family protein [Myxococcota bacterium]